MFVNNRYYESKLSDFRWNVLRLGLAKKNGIVTVLITIVYLLNLRPPPPSSC